MDAQTLAKTIKRRTKRGEWWLWTKVGIPHESSRLTTLMWRGWLQRRELSMNDPLRVGVSAQFAYRWTDAKVPEFHV